MDAHHAREDAILRGRISIVYRLSNNYLFLPFTALCVSASLVHYQSLLWIACAPLIVQIFVAFGASRLKAAYEQRDYGDDPVVWARKFTLFSAFSGCVWGAGAFVWFVPGSFPAQAYLVLAFLGMTSTEFVARGAYRPAYFVHAAASLFPLAGLLALEGNLSAQVMAIIILFFEGVLYTYSGVLERHLDESILLRHDNARLIARLSEEKRLAELARDGAKESERSKSAFISNISHEIRTPLNAALGMAQLLERSNLERNQRDYVRVILEAGRGLKILLDDIIALSQIGDTPLSGTPGDGCDAGQAARTVGRLLQPNAWEKRLRLSVNVAPGLPRVAADPRVLRRILLKLGGNAIKFTERGNIEIAVDAIDDVGGENTLRFRVTDTGPGIPSHLADKIFDLCAKADESYTRRYNGAGLGLAVVQRLVRAMNGTVGVESRTGEGTTFWVAIPAAQSRDNSSIETDEKASAPNGLSILVYLPDRTMRSAVEHMLSPFGNQITFGTSLPDTTRLAARGDFAFVVCDAAAADALIAAPRKHTPILALTGKDDPVPEGAQSILRWPTSANALYSAIGFLTGVGEAEKQEISPDTESEDDILDTTTFADLEKSLGLKTLVDILQSYMTTAEQLTSALSDALDSEEWAETARVAQDIGGAAGSLGLTALTTAARLLARNARDGADQDALAETAKDVLAQHERTRDALRRLYPDLAA
jgi:signal transduction histidine kinase/HPt (histidine-containing phosphotransfer) domain-containing protein